MTTTTLTPTDATVGRGHTMPRAQTRTEGIAGAAPLKNDGYRILQVVLFVAGAVMLPLGLVVIILGWYGAAHTPYQYDQMAYLVSGGLLGLGLTFTGGFLYFGAWLARIAADQRESSKKLSDTLLVLADVVSRTAVTNHDNGAVPAVPARDRDPGEVLVVAGEGSTVHRADCPLVAHREDLRAAGPDAPGLTACRVCEPTLE